MPKRLVSKAAMELARVAEKRAYILSDSGPTECRAFRSHRSEGTGVWTSLDVSSKLKKLEGDDTDPGYLHPQAA